MKSFFEQCPNCAAPTTSMHRDNERTWEMCSACGFSADYVLYTCQHCNPNIFAVCPRLGCTHQGTPTRQLCSPSF